MTLRDRHLGLELPHRPRHVERRVLPCRPLEAGGHGGVRRAALLRRALRHGRGELVVLRHAAARGDARMGGRTPPGFEFSVKLYQKFTHPKMFRETALKAAPGSTGELLDLLAQVTQSDIDEFRAALDPLASAGKLGALLAQFPASFKATPQSRDYLATLLRAFARLPRRRGAAPQELERRSWATRCRCSTRTTPRSCRSTSRSSACRSSRTTCRTSPASTTCACTGGTRRTGGATTAAEDRYDYLYSAEELREFSDVAGAAQALVRKSYLYANNHFASKSVVNAVMLKAQLGQPIDGEYPRDAGRALSRDPRTGQGRRIQVAGVAESPHAPGLLVSGRQRTTGGGPPPFQAHRLSRRGRAHRPDPLRPQLRARRLRRHAVVGHRGPRRGPGVPGVAATGGGAGRGRRRPGHGAAAAGTRRRRHHLRARAAAAHHLGRGRRVVVTGDARGRGAAASRVCAPSSRRRHASPTSGSRRWSASATASGGCPST